MDDTAIGEHPVKSLLALTCPPRFCFHFDKKHLVVVSLEPEEVKEPVWQALDDVLPVHTEESSCIGPEYLASCFSQGHHSEFLNVRLSHG